MIPVRDPHAELSWLLALDPGGVETTCFAFYGKVFSPAEDRASVLSGPLAAIPALTREYGTSPSNIWRPTARGWSGPTGT